MAKRGPKPKPDALKRLAGTDQPSRMMDNAVEFPTPEFGESAPPNWLTNADAVAEWDRLYGLLKANRVLTVGDLTMLAHLCRLHGSIVRRTRAGMDVPSASEAQNRTNYAEFGLTPSSRTRVLAGEARRKNKFADRGRRFMT